MTGAKLRHLETPRAPARQNLLRLNVQKCEIVVFSRNKMKQFPECTIDGELIPADGAMMMIQKLKFSVFPS